MINIKYLNYAVILFHLFLIWFFPYPPLNDLPNHLATIHIINQIIHGDPYLSEAFEFDLFKPAIVPHIVILLLSQIFPILISAKIFLSLYILVFYFSMDYFFKIFNKDNPYLTTISLLFLFNVFFYFGFLGFMLSIPVYFLLFTKLYQAKSNYLLISVSVILLSFFHLATSFLLLLTIVCFDWKKIKDYKFFLYLTPFILLLLYWFSSSIIISDTNLFITSIIDKFLSLEHGISTFIFKISLLFAFSPVGFFFVLIFLIYIYYSKYKLNFKKYILFLSILFILFLFLPESIPQWQFLSSRILPFFIFFIILTFPKVSKIEEPIFFVILLIFLISAIVYTFVAFYDSHEEISLIVSLQDYIEENSSIQYLFVPSRLNVSYAFIQPYLHAQHYITIEKNSVYTTDLFSYWYNPLKSKTYILSDFDHYSTRNITVNQINVKDCKIYNSYFSKVITDLAYPQNDYILLFRDECNATSYFLDNYTIIYNNSIVLMRIKKK
ncbi:MAG: hypothetical protein PHU63_04480 [Candidatus ainarchaeum sp.]|nr:hypothetical protein [Candidatus ainarchaeum sp.]